MFSIGSYHLGNPFLNKEGPSRTSLLNCSGWNLLSNPQGEFLYVEFTFLFFMCYCKPFLKLNILIASFVRRVFSHAYTGIVTS